MLSISQSPLLVRQVKDLWLNQNRVNEPIESPETTSEILGLSSKRDLRNSLSELVLLKPIELTYLNSSKWAELVLLNCHLLF